MKQADVVKNKPYKLVWMQCRNRPELNGAIVTVVKKIPGPPKKTRDQLGMWHKAGKAPARYLLNIGIKVGAANLKELSTS